MRRTRAAAPRATRTARSQFVRVRARPERTIEPQRPSQTVWSGRGTRHLHPLLVHLMGLRGVDDDVAVAIVGPGLFEANALMPAVHAADRIRLDREGEVLVNADFG